MATYDEDEVKALMARNEAAYRDHIEKARARVPVRAQIDPGQELTLYRVTRALRQADIAPEPVVYRKALLQ